MIQSFQYQNHREYLFHGFEIVGISLDKESDVDQEAFLAWCIDQGVTWPQVYDGKGWDAALSALEMADLFGKLGRKSGK